MKKLAFILLLTLLSFKGFSQYPGLFTFTITRDSICLGDSCVSYIMPDTLPNTQWVRDFVADFDVDFDSIESIYIDVQLLDADTARIRDTLYVGEYPEWTFHDRGFSYKNDDYIGILDRKTFDFNSSDADPKLVMNMINSTLSRSVAFIVDSNTFNVSSNWPVSGDNSYSMKMNSDDNTSSAFEIEVFNANVDHDVTFDGRLSNPEMQFRLRTKKKITDIEYFALDTTQFSIGFDQVSDSEDPQYIFKKDSFNTTEPITGDHGHEEVKENTITVATSGGDFTSIKAAAESITTSSRSNRFIIDVSAGNYIEDNPIMLPRYVALKSSGGTGTVVIIPENVGPVLCASGRSTIDGFTIINGPNGATSSTGVLVDSAGFVRIDNMIFNSLDTSVYVSNALSATFSENIFLVSDSSRIDIGIYVDGGHITVNNLRLPGRDTVSTAVYVTGEQSSAIINGMISGSNNLDTAIYATDTSFVIVNTSTLSNCLNGLMSFNQADVKFNGNTHTDFQGSFTTEGNGGKLRGYANNNDNDEALIIEGQELHVGDAAQGYEVCLGEGDSYSDDLLSYMYDGSTSWSLGDSLKDNDGIYVEFPNLTANTALYIASDIDTIIHHGIKLAMEDSMTIGSGEVISEYWNGSTWAEFNGMVTDGDAPFSYHAKDYFEQTQSTQIRYDITITNDDWVANDPVSHGSVKKWIRYRIATAITISPKIDQLKLHSSRLEVNADGYPESFGNARNSQLLQLSIGSGSPIEGNMQSQDIYVDQNIGVGYQNNRFTATGDILGFPVNFPDNVDTSSPLSFVWSGRATNAASIQWTVRWFILTPDGTLYTTEPGASGDAYSATTTARATVIGDNELFSIAMDVSEAIPSRIGDFGDQLWITIQPTTLSGSFDLTNIGAEYWTWSEGGHY